MVCNRLEVICHEDLDTLAAPWVVPFVATALAQSRERYSKSIGEARLMVGKIEHRFPAEQPERFRALAQELAESKVDVIVAVTGLGAQGG